MVTATSFAGSPEPTGFHGLLALDQVVFDAFPTAAYVCAADGRVVRFNRRAVELWGRTPRSGDTDQRFCGAVRLYHTDGRPLPHDQTPMEAALRTGEAQHDKEVIVERPDGSRATVLVNIEALLDEDGCIEGAINCFQDITLRKRSELLLRENRHRLRELLEAIPIALYTTDAEGRVTFFNAAAAQLAGREPVLGSDRWCVSWRLSKANGENMPLAECPMAIALKEHRPVRGVEALVERPDGTRVPVMPFPTPLYDASGMFVGGVNLMVDITEVKRAEQALRESERTLAKRACEQTALYQFTDRLHRAELIDDVYEAALDLISRALGCERASILLFDGDGVMRFVASRGLSEGYRRAVEGHSPWPPGERNPAPLFVPEIGGGGFSDDLRATIAEEGIGALAFIPLVADGKLIGKFMTYYDAPHEFGEDEVVLALTAARQVAFGVARKQSERECALALEELRSNEERLRLATQAGKIGLWEWDIRANRVTWTNSLFPMHGIDRDAFKPTVEGFGAMVHPDDRARVKLAIDDALAGRAPYDLEFRILKPSGQVTWIFTNAMVLRDEGGPLRMIGATVDITERKEAESQRELMVAELSHRVKNTLATVISIAQQSFAKGPSIDEARRSFDARIRALAQTHTRLAESHWLGVPVNTILSDELAPYRNEDADNVHLAGPPVTLNPRCALTFGMAIHELVTNAAKYGALSARGGSIEVSWHIAPENKWIHLAWVEKGGPRVEAPQRSGFGRLLLERALASDLRGTVALDFAPDGLRCDIVFPDECSSLAG